MKRAKLTTTLTGMMCVAAVLSAQTEVKLTAADGAADDRFGFSVAVDGNTAIAGAAYGDGNEADSGAAYVMYREPGGSGWTEQAKLVAKDGVVNDVFGYAVALEGDTAVVGAVGIGSGAAFVFYRNQGRDDAWGQVAMLTPGDASAFYFGSSVAIAGDTVVVGAVLSGPYGATSGAAYVFYRNLGGADAWGQVTRLTASDAAPGAYFGVSVALEGDTIVVGANSADGNAGASGAAYVFYRDQGGTDTWGEVAKLVAADGETGDELGQSVAIAGDTVVVSAAGGTGQADDSGAAHVFYRDQGGADSWGEVAKLSAADGATGDSFGLATSLSGDTLVVGAPYTADNGPKSGAAYLFHRDQGGPDGWGEVARLVASDADPYLDFGGSIAISGDIVVVGASEHFDPDPVPGAVYIYTYPLFADGFESGDTSGWSETVVGWGLP
jgi:hypothetical protein